MKNLLFISSYPFPLDKGSNQHAYYFLKALCARFKVTCIFFTQPGHDLPDDIDKPLAALDIYQYDICRFSLSPKRGRVVATLRRLGAFPGPYMNLAVNSANLEKIESVVRKNAIEVMHIEHFHYAKYACRIRSKLKKAIVYHDLHHTIYWQKAKFEKRIVQKILLWIDSWKYGLFQRWLDWHVDAKVFLNAEEMALLPEKAIYIPHIANQEIEYKRPRHTDVLNLLFIGSFKHPPNVLSVAYIVERIFPMLAVHTDKFKLHIVGSGTEHLQSMVDQTPYAGSVEVHGFISDINDAFKNMDIALFPILYGGGVKTKIIDAMAAGIPVVTTPEGVHGLHNLPRECIGIGKTPIEIVDQVRLLMDNHALRVRRSHAGERYIRKNTRIRYLRIGCIEPIKT